MSSEQGSQPIYKVREEKHAYVAMRDGVRLAIDIYRPDAEGRFPALLAISPYGKEVQQLPLPPQAVEVSPLWNGCMEAGDTEYIVSRGYVHLIADSRGTGDSEGEYIGLFSKHEAEDGYDLVEWIAQQPWCDGNVGMTGICYYGTVQLFVAAEQPPHLKAICPFEMWTDDLYSHCAYDGGVLYAFTHGLFYGRDADSGYAPKNVVSAMIKNTPKEELDRLFQEATSNSDIRGYPVFYHLLKYPQKNPPFVDILLNPNDGPFYWERSAYTKYDKIKIPVYAGGCWGGFIPWSVAPINVYQGISSPKKLFMIPSIAPRPWRNYHDVVIRWFDHWLKGIDTGIMNEPPIKFFVVGADRWREEHEWPLATTEWTKFYLHSGESLSLEPETQEELDSFLQEPLSLSPERQMLKYLTLPLPEDTEVTGPVALHLYASIDTDDTNWRADVKDVDEHGLEGILPVTRGWLKASHRALDESKSEPWQPHHPHLKPEPVVLDEIYEYAIELQPISYLFKAGHRIKLEISSIDSARDPATAVPPSGFHICSSKTTRHTIYHGRERPSHLLVPVIPKT